MHCPLHQKRDMNWGSALTLKYCAYFGEKKRKDRIICHDESFQSWLFRTKARNLPCYRVTCMASSFSDLWLTHAFSYFVRLCNSEELTNWNELIIIPGRQTILKSLCRDIDQGREKPGLAFPGTQDQILVVPRILPWLMEILNLRWKRKHEYFYHFWKYCG